MSLQQSVDGIGVTVDCRLDNQGPNPLRSGLLLGEIIDKLRDLGDIGVQSVGQQGRHDRGISLSCGENPGGLEVTIGNVHESAVLQ